MAAKSLSEEKVAENRMAALALMETILSRMNGDLQRLTRICGANLSDKALKLLQERWAKRESKAAHPPSTQRRTKPPTNTPPRDSHAPTPSNREMPGTPSSLYDELPALSLRQGSAQETAGMTTPRSGVAIEASDVFSFPRKDRAMVGESESPKTTEQKANHVSDTEDADGAGAAASLRARLLRIREKSTTAEDNGVEPGEVPDSIDETQRELFSSEQLQDEMDVIRSLLAKPGPVAEDDPLLVDGIDVLKKFHAALSRQNTSSGFPEEFLAQLRECIASNMDSVVEQLTQ